MRPETRYSVQQIKFEFLSYIKEFGGTGADWSIGVADRGPEATLAANAVDPQAGIWIAKPAVSARAAALVEDHFTDRFRVAPAPVAFRGPDAHWVFLFRRQRRLELVSDRTPDQALSTSTPDIDRTLELDSRDGARE